MMSYSSSSSASIMSRGRNQQQLHRASEASNRRRRQCLSSSWHMMMMMMMMNVGILALVILPMIGVSGWAFSTSKQSCMLYSRRSRRLSSPGHQPPPSRIAPSHSSWTLQQTPKDDQQQQQEDVIQVSSSTRQPDIKTNKEPASSVVISTQKEAEDSPPSPPYPIDLPSPLLLGSAIFLAIAATGSLFQVFLGDGSTVTSSDNATVSSLAIGVIGLPIAIFLFYASILKAQVETQQDDEVFLGGRGRGGNKR